MAKIGMFWGSSSQMTALASEGIKSELELLNHDVNSYDVRDGIGSLPNYKNVIIGCPTWNVGELQDDWDMLFDDFQKISFNNVTGAFFGSGDQFGYSCNYLDAVGILARKFIENGGSLIGKWSTDGYEFDESIALYDGKFLGLALDYDNQSSLSEERIKQWVNMIHLEFN
ncbi:MAG: flavodoxin [Opitutae bacterium]|nr:flavodoxin [Opitutae bacterium]